MKIYIYIILKLNKSKCITDCTAQPYPGEPGSPNMPDEARLIINIFIGSGNSSVTIPEYLIDEDDVQIEENQNMGCDQIFDPKIYIGGLGKAFRITCPRFCILSKVGVIGHEVYQWQSSICKAAIHGGIILNEKGGEIIVKVSTERSQFTGSDQNGVISSDISFDYMQRSFVIEIAPKLILAECTLTADSDRIKNAQEKFGNTIAIRCPQRCMNQPIVLYGSNQFSVSSSICQAGVFIGAIGNDVGGVIQIVIGSALNEYIGKKRGIFTSLNLQNPGLIFKSFKIISQNIDSNQLDDNDDDSADEIKLKIGIKHQITFEYDDDISNQEQDETKILIKQNQDDQIRKAEISIPSIVERYIFNKRIWVIELTRTIDINPQYEINSVHWRHEFAVRDGLISFKVLWVSIGSLGIYFRAFNNQNYMLLRIIPNGDNSLIRLIQLNNGEPKTLGDFKYTFTTETWYTFHLYLNESKIQLQIQTETSRKITQIFSIVDEYFLLGEFGFAVYGNYRVLIQYPIKYQQIGDQKGVIGIKVKIQKQWPDCLIKATTKIRDNFCQKQYGVKIQYCKKLAVYCDYCCKKYVSKLERIYMHTCWRRCYAITFEHKRNLIRLALQLREGSLKLESNITQLSIIEEGKTEYEYDIQQIIDNMPGSIIPIRPKIRPATEICPDDSEVKSA